MRSCRRETVERLHAPSPDLNRDTVYRNLMELSESGLVSRLDLGDQVWRFELSEKGAGQARAHPQLMHRHSIRQDQFSTRYLNSSRSLARLIRSASDRPSASCE